MSPILSFLKQPLSAHNSYTRDTCQTVVLEVEGRGWGVEGAGGDQNKLFYMIGVILSYDN